KEIKVVERLVECVPNFSEGRNADTVRALVSVIRAVKGVFLLDEEMDQDHHRAVLTFVGVPEAVGEAAFQAAHAAAGLIDRGRRPWEHGRHSSRTTSICSRGISTSRRPSRKRFVSPAADSLA